MSRVLLVITVGYLDTRGCLISPLYITSFAEPEHQRSFALETVPPWLSQVKGDLVRTSLLRAHQHETKRRAQPCTARLHSDTKASTRLDRISTMHITHFLRPPHILLYIEANPLSTPS